MDDKDLNKIGKLVREIVNEEVTNLLEVRLKPIEKNIKVINNKIDTLIRVYDREHRHVNRRLDRLENKLDLEPIPHKV